MKLPIVLKSILLISFGLLLTLKAEENEHEIPAQTKIIEKEGEIPTVEKKEAKINGRIDDATIEEAKKNLKKDTYEKKLWLTALICSGLGFILGFFVKPLMEAPPTKRVTVQNNDDADDESSLNGLLKKSDVDAPTRGILQKIINRYLNDSEIHHLMKFTLKKGHRDLTLLALLTGLAADMEAHDERMNQTTGEAVDQIKAHIRKHYLVDPCTQALIPKKTKVSSWMRRSFYESPQPATHPDPISSGEKPLIVNPLQ